MSGLGGFWGAAGSFSLVVGVLREAGVWFPLETASSSSLRLLEELAPRLLGDRLQEPFTTLSHVAGGRFPGSLLQNPHWAEGVAGAPRW